MSTHVLSTDSIVVTDELNIVLILIAAVICMIVLVAMHGFGISSTSNLGKINIIARALILLIASTVLFSVQMTNINVIIYLVIITLLLNKLEINKSWIKYIFSIASLLICIATCVAIQEVMYNNTSWIDKYSYMIDVEHMISIQSEYLELNITIMTVVVSAISVLLGSRLGATLSISSALILNLVNAVVYQGRGTSLHIGDFTAIKTALGVADGYSLKLTSGIVTGILMAIAVICLVNFTVRYKNTKKERIICAASNIAVLYLSMALLVPYCNVRTLRDKEIISRSFNETHYGLALDLFSGIIYSKVEEPEGYEDVAEHIENMQFTKPSAISEYNLGNAKNNLYTSLDFIGETTTPDNVVVIMAESLCNLEDYEGIEFDKPYIPYISSLMDNPNILSGYMVAPGIGGATANSEFEVLTGCTTDIFYNNTYPYILYIKNKFPSIVHNFNEAGYKTTALHNYHKEGYNRNNVYDLLGFDNKYFVDSEVFNTDDTLFGYVKDKYGFDYILKNIKESDEKTFNFFVTMQGHGNYIKPLTLSEVTNTPNLETFDVELKNVGKTSELSSIMNNYAIAQNQFDKDLERFIEDIQEIDETTLVVVFGDHRCGYDIQLDITGFDSVLRRLTPFVVLSNYKLPSVPNGDQLVIGAPFLGSFIVDIANVGMTAKDKALLELYECMPAIGEICYMCSDLSIASTREELDNTIALDAIKKIGYDMITGKNKQFYFDILD